MKQMSIKPNPQYARRVPKLSERVYNSIKDSFKKYGQRDPIIVNQNGIILDGHHRFRICNELGIKPRYKIIKFENKLEERLFVSQSNLERRNASRFVLTEIALGAESDLKEVARKNSKFSRKQNQDSSVRILTLVGRVNDQIADMAGVSRDTVIKVRKILESLEEDDLDKLRSEEVSINEAYNQILYVERLQKINAIIEPYRLQAQEIMTDAGNAAKRLEQIENQLLGTLQTNPNNLSEQQKQEYAQSHLEFQEKQIYAQILSHAVFTVSSSTKITTNAINLKNKIPEALEKIKETKNRIGKVGLNFKQMENGGPQK